MTKPQTDVGSRIILGDCLGVMRGFADNQFDIVLTDPPYGKKASKGTNGFGSAKNRKYTDDWDNFAPTQEYFDELRRVSKHQIIFGGNYFSDKLPPSNCWIVWDKKGDHKFNNPFADCELIWTSFNKVVKKYTVIAQGFVKDSKDVVVHPTQKPTELLKMIMAEFVQDGWTILDPFAGSGSTLKAAKDLGFNATGIEISPKYVKIAEERLKQEILL